MNDSVVKEDEAIWSRLKGAHIAYRLAMQEFSATEVDRVRLLRPALMGHDRHVALALLPYLSVEELGQLLKELTFLASFSHGAIQYVRDQILRLPYSWILTRIEDVAEPLLAGGTYDEYRRLLELYALLDPELTRKLATRAANHADLDIREAGEDFLT